MGWNRREVVGVVASGLLAGCAGVSVPSIPNPLGGDGGETAPAGASTPGPTPSPTPNATATTTGGPAGGGPAVATRRAFDELEWFATEYGPATNEFSSLAARTRNLADSLSRRSSVSEDAVSGLRRLMDRVETSAYDRLGPHFDGSPSIRAFNDERIGRIRTLRGREDWDGVSGALAAVAERYATLSTESYVAGTFPRDPVRGPLVDYATSSGHAEDAVFVAYHEGADAEIRFQDERGAHPGTPPGGRADASRYRELFGPLAPDAGGETGAYVTVNSLIDGRTLTLSVQRYADPGAAGSAVDGLLAGSVTEERTAEFGGREWRRVYYRPGTDLVYADLTRAGAFVVAAGASPRPWGDRPTGWQSPLKLTWIWE